MKAGFQEVVKQSKKLEQKLDDHQTRITQLEEDSTFLPHEGLWNAENKELPRKRDP